MANTVKLDMTPGYIQSAVSVSQYDDGLRSIDFELYKDGSAYNIPSGATVTINGHKPDGNVYSVPCTYSGNKVTVTFTKQMTAVDGFSVAEISIVSGSMRLSSANFRITVEKSPMPDNAVVSESQIPLIEEAGQHAAEALASRNEAAEYAKQASDSAAAAASASSTGFSTEAINKLEEVGNYLAYTTADGRSKWTELITILRNGSSGGTPAVYGQPVTDKSLLKMAQQNTAILGVKLDTKPTQDQTISILSDSNVVTFDKETLKFTSANWNEYQFVTITAGVIDNDTSANIILRNSDELMSDKVIPIYVSSEGYAVDTTIPSDAHVVTADDFESANASGSNNVYLGAYKGTYSNIYVPKTIEVDGVTKNVILRGEGTFKNNATIQYVTVEDGVYASQYGQAYNGQWVGLFSNCTNLIGVKYEGNDITTLQNCFNTCSSLKFFDGLENQTNCTSMRSTFGNCASLEYVQDISKLNKLSEMENVFNGCSSLKRIFGLPSSYETDCSWRQAFYKCTLLESIEVPNNVSSLFYCFADCSNLRKAIFNDDDLTSANSLAAQTFQNCTNLNVYATSGSTTYATLESVFGSSTNVIINDKSGLSKPYIVTWGDSTTSLNPAWIDWPRRLQEKVTEYIVKNQAVSGEWTTSTSARQGGNALKVGAFTIPSDTSKVEITLTSTDGQTFGSSPVFSAGASFNPCTIAGVKGTITNSSNKYYFTRYEAGESVEVSNNTAVVSNVDDMLNNASNIMLIDLGTNAGWNGNTDTLLNQVQLMVNHFTSKGGTKYIICGASSGQYLRTESDRTVWLEYEQKASTRFGEHWLNMREYLIQNGLTENGLSASTLDNERIAQGLVPASLLGGGSTTDIKMYDGETVTDDTHPNAYGQNSKMNAFYNKGKALGYWD